ncbi:hypothetical protein CF326_g5181 [Tilletia indica]|nr:hypothetical protein CF326_g5181 [Tilletia indica]
MSNNNPADSNIDFNEGIARYAIIQLVTQVSKQDNFDNEELDIDHIVNGIHAYALDMPDDRASDSLILKINRTLAIRVPALWTVLLLGVVRDWALMGGSAGQSSIIRRREEPRGLRFFHQRRQGKVRINSFQEFRQMFHVLSVGVLRDLSFANIIIAGGIALACLTETAFSGYISPNSDIDIFVHGLDAVGATAKVKDIESTMRRNLIDFEDHYQVERSVSAISFVPKESASQFRKIQVILRLHKNPGEILANFDLDQVAIGYDDEEVWMEPRALRAILTGYSFASTERINRVTTDRLGKYATRGYGFLLRPGALCNPEESTMLTDRMSRLATEAHDRIGKHIFNLRHRCSAELLEHESVNVGTVLRHAQLSKTGRWLDNYQNFAIFAAIWNHAATHERTLQQFAEQLLKKDTTTCGPEDFDYNSPYHTITGNEDWHAAIMKACHWRYFLDKTLMPTKIWISTGATVEQVLEEPLNFFTFLPEGWHTMMRVLSPVDSSAALLEHILEHEKFKDTDGVGFNLCVWKQDSTQMWQPRDDLGRHVHGFLRKSAMTSTWALRHLMSTFDWESLCFGSVTARWLLVNDVVRNEIEDQTAFHDWCSQSYP